ncbi:serine palmitoyltransferase [Roseovarius marisflavi]|uniref:Serine palmitoyltransferase n=1 Tax=Roseovarius marisflavi TaxID=1054996 RepID=A0A1M6WYK8_9RHOB|nr:aminotransferase class I/II-fold pyridoxal phosphate-dependent enzyme [Roseovarius marisflavi]SHK98669.1 serine palmitoyltransferase [Roseovarius marisflavi]
MFDTEANKNTVFAKFEKLSERVDKLRAAGRTPFGMRFDEMLSQTRARVGNAEILLAGTNNYLGLTYDADVMEAAKQAIDTHGTATTGSRLANGTYSLHLDLETDLKEYFGAASAMVCTTGYQANLAALSTLAGRGDHLLIDADSHACIYDACRLSDAETIRFRHNSPEDLNKRLSRLPAEGARLVVIEGLYSMLGDVAPVAEFVEVAHSNGAMIFVDEAHSIGCYGENGRGVSQAQGVLDKVDFISGTFSKSFASIGGFCVSRHEALELIRLVSRPYLFTASGSPANMAAARASLKVIASDTTLRKQLWDRVHQLYSGLTDAGFTISSPPGPIMAISRPDEHVAVAEWNQLMDQGVYVNLAVPPATPQAKSLLRLSVSAAHTEADIDQLIAAFRGLAKGD